MTPPANFYNSDYSARNISNYSLIDEGDFQKTWTQLDILDSPKVNVEETDQETAGNYFDTGLNLDNVLKSHKASPVEPVSQPCQNGTGKARSGTARPALPKYGFVAMLQLAFGIPNLLEENRFLNKDVAKKVAQRHEKKKRVSFAKVELHDKHLPYCRRNSLKQEFGYLHAPQCTNYGAEQALGKQEFLIRGNFIRDNTKPTTEQDFYFDPSKCCAETLPIRQVLPLDFSLKNNQCPVLPLHLDSKSSTMDSITYHEKTSPGLRRTPPPATDKEQPSLNFAPKPNIRPMPCQPIFTDEDIISPPPSAESTVRNIETLPKELTNVTSRGIKSESETTETNLHELPTAILRDSPIVPQIAVTSWTNEPAGSPICSPLESCDSLKLTDDGLKLTDDGLKLPNEITATRTGSFASSEDSGYSGDFVDEFLDNLSDDSDSASEEEEEDTSFVEKTPEHKLESESETVCDGPPSSSSLSTVSSTSSESDIEEDPEEVFKDSGIGSLSDDDDLETLIKSNPVKSRKPAATQPKMWFVEPLGQPAAATAEVQTKPVSSEKPFEVQEGYVNPFSKRTSDSVQLKPPSVLGRLVCDTKVVIVPVRLGPERVPDRFMFDTPSPDDVIRIRQAGVMS